MKTMLRKLGAALIMAAALVVLAPALLSSAAALVIGTAVGAGHAGFSESRKRSFSTVRDALRNARSDG